MSTATIDSKAIFDEASDRVARRGLPLPRQPSGKNLEYNYPDDPDSMSDIELGQKMSKFMAWYTYCMRLLGIVESEQVPVESEYMQRMGVAILEVRETLAGRPPAKLVEALILRDDVELGKLHKRKIELASVKAQLKPRLKIYNESWNALSRELTRRNMERE